MSTCLLCDDTKRVHRYYYKLNLTVYGMNEPKDPTQRHYVMEERLEPCPKCLPALTDKDAKGE